ncbi:hypothetical protein WA026_000456 [Henosepilachna vigintioctopunctata]|uniref:DDE Tnp4 domain-containing protein n=1 Tax=Henosepilachna vigintioctopunctata TaxID=420089 RepID=A0AAW1V632_9CUCU
MDLTELILANDDIESAICSTFFDDSDSSSSSDDEYLLLGKCIIESRVTKYDRPIDHMNDVKNYSDEDFIRSFRVNRKTAFKLIEGFKNSDIYERLIKRANSRLWTITAEKTILLFLWFAGHQNQAYRDITKKFNINPGTLFRVISDVSRYLNSIADEIIKWPNKEQQYSTKTHYLTNKGFPNVVGCIGNVSISITKPLDDFIHIWDSDEQFRFILQAVCNEQKKFIDIFVSSPGVTETSVIFNKSLVCERLNENDNKDSLLITSNFYYPLLKNLMAPYVGNEKTFSSQQVHFNKKLIECCSDLDNTFILLKRRFKQLHHVKLRDPTRNVNFIRACCVLHNIADEEDHIYFQGEECVEDNLTTPAEAAEEIFLSSEGSLIREKICKNIYNSI